MVLLITLMIALLHLSSLLSHGSVAEPLSEADKGE